MSQIWQKLSRYRLWIIATVIILIAAKMAVTLYAGKTPQNPVGKMITVERGNIVSMVSATGTIKPVNMVDISSKISGLIKEVKVNENDQVKAGQVLLMLDDTHLQAQVAQAKARMSIAAGKNTRNQRLYTIGAVADQDMENSRTDYSIAQAAYDDAMSQLNDTVIRSPIDGRVIGKPIPAGQAVAPGISSPMVLMTVVDMSKMQIETQVDESDIGKIQMGQKVTFTVDAYPGKTFSGVVSRVSDKANIQQNVVYYGVLIDVDGAGDLLKPTMTARVSINVGESKNTLVVPLSVVKSNNGKQYVAIMSNGKAQNQPITTGLTSDDKVEVVSGLSEGDQVVAPQAKSQTANGGQGGQGAGMGGMFRGTGK